MVARKYRGLSSTTDKLSSFASIRKRRASTPSRSSTNGTGLGLKPDRVVRQPQTAEFRPDVLSQGLASMTASARFRPVVWEQTRIPAASSVRNGRTRRGSDRRSSARGIREAISA